MVIMSYMAHTNPAYRSIFTGVFSIRIFVLSKISYRIHVNNENTFDCFLLLICHSLDQRSNSSQYFNFICFFIFCEDQVVNVFAHILTWQDPSIR